MRWISGAAHEAEIEKLAVGSSRIAADVAFLSEYGADFILGLAKGCAVDLTISTYMGTTRRSALVTLLEALKKPGPTAKNLQVRVARQTDRGFHGKVYRFDREDGGRVWIVGSANLTETGLTGTGDVSLVLDDPDGCGGPGLVLTSHMKLSKWATAADPSSLASVIETYRESVNRGGVADGENPQVRFVAGVTEKLNAVETDVLERVQSADAPEDIHFEFNGRRDADSYQIIVKDGKYGAKYRVVWECRPGDILIQGWEGETGVEAHRVIGNALGTHDGIDAAIAFLDAADLPVKRKDLGAWRSRTLRGDDIPVSLRRLLESDGGSP